MLLGEEDALQQIALGADGADLRQVGADGAALVADLWQAMQVPLPLSKTARPASASPCATTLLRERRQLALFRFAGFGGLFDRRAE